MYGIEFNPDTYNALVCASFEFECRRRPGVKHMRIRIHPDTGMCLDVLGKDGWENVVNRGTNEDVENHLPKRSDYGKDWTVGELFLAGTFYADGAKSGVIRGRMQASDDIKNGRA